ncbi:leucine-rich repeat-containing protein 34 [Menidia menidia]
MDGRAISEHYRAVCAEHGIKTSPKILEALETTPETENLTLKLAGNSRLKPIHRLCDEDVFSLAKCLRDDERVSGLDVGYNHIGDEGARHLAELLQAEKSALRFLDLTFNDIQTDGAQFLASSLQHNGRLLSLRLSGNKIGNSGAMRLAAMLQENGALQELELADCDLATQSVIALSIALRTNRTLRSLDISRPLLFSHQEEWAEHFSGMLAVNGVLVELRLGKTGLSDSGAERLSAGLKQNRGLRLLDLRCNRLSRDGARHLAAALGGGSGLEVLDLSANRIEDEGAEHLSDAIAQPGGALRELSVRSNSIGAGGLLSLAAALRSSTLTHLYLWGNRLEEPVCQAFSQLLASGRLAPGQTDVSSYQVDGRLFLAEASQGVRRRHYRAETPPPWPPPTQGCCPPPHSGAPPPPPPLQYADLSPLPPAGSQ